MHITQYTHSRSLRRKSQRKEEREKEEREKRRKRKEKPPPVNSLSPFPSSRCTPPITTAQTASLGVEGSPQYGIARGSRNQSIACTAGLVDLDKRSSKSTLFAVGIRIDSTGRLNQLRARRGLPRVMVHGGHHYLQRWERWRRHHDRARPDIVCPGFEKDS